MTPPADVGGWTGRGRLLALAAALLLAAPLAGSPAPQVRGAVYAGDPSHPAAGVLIAFYDAGDLLLDSTYSRDDGGFRLLTPLGSGRFYVVATGGGNSLRKDFTLDPVAGRTRNLALVFPRQSWPVRVGGWVLDKLGAVVGLLIGFLFRSLFEERLAAKSKRDFFLSDVRAAINEALAKYPHDPQQLLQQRAEIQAAVRSIAQLLDRRGDVQDALAKLRKDKGRQSFRALQERIRNLEDTLRQAAAQPDIPQRQQLGEVKARLQELEERPLA